MRHQSICKTQIYLFVVFFFLQNPPYLLEFDVNMKIMTRLSSLKNCYLYLYHKDRHDIHAGYINSQYVYFGVIITIQSYTYLLFANSIVQFTHHMIL